MRGLVRGARHAVVIAAAAGLVAGCSDCFERWPEAKDRTRLAMMGNFVAGDVTNDPWTDEVSHWPTESARLVMLDGTATLIVRQGADEYRLAYAMKKHGAFELETDNK